MGHREFTARGEGYVSVAQLITLVLLAATYLGLVLGESIAVHYPLMTKTL